MASNPNSPKAGRCLIRDIADQDCPHLEQFFLDHEGESLPGGYLEEFRFTIRDPEVIYFVAENDEGEVVGGGGICHYVPGVHASLCFGIVKPSECRKGFGTSLMLARLFYIDAGKSGCEIGLQATVWSEPFFSRLGFKWHSTEKDEAGNVFFQGSHMVYPGDRKVFKSILDAGEVRLEI